MRRRTVLASGLAALAAPRLAGAQTRWVMATAYPDGNYHTQNIRQFLDEVEKASSGKLDVRLHSNASLLPMLQIKRAVQTGQIQLGEILMAAYGNEDPLFEVDFIPFLADTWDRARALNEATEPLLRARFERQGMTLLYLASGRARASIAAPRSRRWRRCAAPGSVPRPRPWRASPSWSAPRR